MDFLFDTSSDQHRILCVLSVLSMKALCYDQGVIGLRYAKTVYVGRCINNNNAEKHICIFTIYFYFAVRKIDSSHKCDRSSQGKCKLNSIFWSLKLQRMKQSGTGISHAHVILSNLTFLLVNNTTFSLLCHF